MKTVKFKGCDSLEQRREVLGDVQQILVDSPRSGRVRAIKLLRQHIDVNLRHLRDAVDAYQAMGCWPAWIIDIVEAGEVTVMFDDHIVKLDRVGDGPQNTWDALILERDGLKDELTAVQKMNSELSAEQHKLRQILVGEQRRCQLLSNERDVLKVELAAVQKNCQKLHDEKLNLMHELKDIEGVNQAFADQSVSMFEELTDAQCELIKLREQCQAQEAELKAIKVEVKDAWAEARRADAILDGLKRERQLDQVAFNSLKEENEHIRRLRATSDEQASRLEKLNELAQARITELEKQLDDERIRARQREQGIEAAAFKVVRSLLGV